MPKWGQMTWRPAFGAWRDAGGVHFRVWAPRALRVDVVLEGEGVRPLAPGTDGCFTGTFADLRSGLLYRYRIDGRGPYPDPASRFQPSGVTGPSELVEADRFSWSDARWSPPALSQLVLYELHVGTFAGQGTFASVAARLPDLVALGVTAVELMPVADFPGDRNWGYDGVALFAPARCYGRPDDLRGLVDQAHALGLAIVLDVVYNHVGPDGAYHAVYSPSYFSTRHRSPWGAAVNLDGPDSRMVREFLIENALHWLHEYHVDGLRLDATHALIDESPRHWLAALAARVRASGLARSVYLIAEDERNLVTLVEPAERGGYGLDAVWADDFHHQVRRLTAGDSEGYFREFSGSGADLAATVKRGWFFCGDRPARDGRREPRGTDPVGTPLERFVICLQNHDQVGNRAFGARLHHQIDLARYRAASALLLCAPETPLLFMGQEWAATTPFLYFTDHEPGLGRRVTEGRRREFRHFSEFADPSAARRIPDPQARATFDSSRLDRTERYREPHASVWRLYQALLRLRRSEPTLQASVTSGELHIETVGDRTILMTRADGSDRLLVAVHFGEAASVEVVQAAPAAASGTDEARWEVVLTTEDAAFTTDGCPPRLTGAASAPTIEFQGPAAIILKAAGRGRAS